MSDSNPPEPDSTPQVHWWSAAVNGMSADTINSLVRKGGQLLEEEGAKALEEIKKQASALDSGKLVQEGVQQLNQWIPSDINRLTAEGSRAAQGFIKDGKAMLEGSELSQEAIRRFNYAIDATTKAHYGALPADAWNWMKANPEKVAFHVVNGVIIFSPEIVSKPLLWSLGFMSNGPRVASAASAYQATVGNVPAHSLFAYLESAAAGGYGAARVNAATRASAIVAELGADVWKSKSKIEEKSDTSMMEADTNMEKQSPLDPELDLPAQNVAKDKGSLPGDTYIKSKL